MVELIIIQYYMHRNNGVNPLQDMRWVGRSDLM